jgi:methionyl-tRNA synthetase
MNYQALNEEDLLNHQEHFIDFAKNDIDYFKFIPAKLRNQQEFILNFIQYLDSHPQIYSDEYISRYCKEIMDSSLVYSDNKEVLMRLTDKNSNCFEYASDNLRCDKELILVAVKAASRANSNIQWNFNHYTFRHFPTDLQEKLSSMNSYDEVIKYLESEILHDNLLIELKENVNTTKKIKI